jgi:imidazolonepropionase-like amidohydrolase
MPNPTGTLEAGKAADVVVVDGNAAEDIAALHRVATIVKQSQIAKRNGKLLI